MKKRSILARALSIVALFIALPVEPVAAGSPGPARTEPETHALTGEPLVAPSLPAEVRTEREAQLVQALSDLSASPRNAEALIWAGRRTAYLGRYRDAVEIFSRAIETHPNDPRLYRHRGHRYLTLRQLDAAIADLERAAKLIAGSDDEVEPDGLPNARNLPRSTLHSNVWYHLGLAYYLKGDFENAARCYSACLKVSNNPDMLCATTHWFYMTLRRLGQDEKAAGLLDAIEEEMEILENGSYHELLLMYKGLREFEDLESRAFSADDGIDPATLGYGLGNWLFYNAQTRRALDIFRRVVSGKQWAAFGHLAAEAELSRIKGRRAQ